VCTTGEMGTATMSDSFQCNGDDERESIGRTQLGLFGELHKIDSTSDEFLVDATDRSVHGDE
jgi:hypothetical protein